MGMFADAFILAVCMIGLFLLYVAEEERKR